MPPPDTFKKCQLCEHTSDDICEFRMWQRCDEQDNLIESHLITCNSEACFQQIDADPILFREVPWSQGGPGRFMLLCGNCPNRKEFDCQHPNLKSNGGKGLLVNLAQPFLGGARVCMADGTSFRFGNPADRCEGHPDPKRAPTKDVPR
jgi:hypothetical protein